MRVKALKACLSLHDLLIFTVTENYYENLKCNVYNIRDTFMFVGFIYQVIIFTSDNLFSCNNIKDMILPAGTELLFEGGTGHPVGTQGLRLHNLETR